MADEEPKGSEQQTAEPSAAVATDTAEPPTESDPRPDGQPVAEETAESADGAAEGEVSAEASVSPAPEEELSGEVKRILHISVPVIVKLADKQLSLGDIIDLSPGSIVEFTRSADTPLELMVNNKIIGRGMAVKVGEKFGLRIDEVYPVEDTIRSLGV